MIASLPMYARPELDAAHARYWQLIREGLNEHQVDSPEHLTTDLAERDTWSDSSLLLGQTCGLPYRRWLHTSVQLVGTPDFGVDGCEPGWYRSAIICRSDNAADSLVDLADGVFAYNSDDSQSGHNALMSLAHQRNVTLTRSLETGGHARSARAVADGRADFASIDAVSWRLMRRYDDATSDLRVVEWTDPTPGLPYIAAPGVNVDALRSSIDGAIQRLLPDDRDALGILGLERIPAQAYLEMDDND
jgi:ABC-type phosphate/phosphonate transport system substrate-binding protein